MVITLSPEIDDPQLEGPAPVWRATLANGDDVALDGMSVEQLQELQWEQEQLFARRIMAAPKGSAERAQTVGQAYDTICKILSAQAPRAAQPLVMGLDARYVRLVLSLLRRQSDRGHSHQRLFEIGYGSGALLAEVRQYGWEVGGIEVSSLMRDQALQRIGQRHARSLLLGDVRSVDVAALGGRPTLIYWNDVLEHIPPDEVSEYVAHLYELLAPGGALVTVTPNWLLRPSDVTGDFCPWRTEARGLHLKEYHLDEVAQLLRQCGFCRVATPLFSTHGRLVVCGDGGRMVKQRLEPWLDRLPVRMARWLCRALAMSVTIASK